MRRNVIAVIAGCSALAALPAAAGAQSGFPDYRQAAADQYPTQPPPGTTGSGENPSAGGNPSSAGGNPATGASSGRPRPVHRPKRTTAGATKHTASGNRAPSSTGGTEPVAVRTGSVPAAKGSLPFTGSDLSGLVVLALILIATGFLLAAVARATRRRRRRAPA
jgi:hypothetical protein